MLTMFYIMVVLFGIGVIWWVVDSVIGLAEVEREFFADYFFKRVFPPVVFAVLIVWALFAVGGLQ